MERNIKIHITDRDRLLRSWEKSMELVRDFQNDAKESKDDAAAKLFSDFAEEEARHAAAFLELLHACEERLIESSSCGCESRDK